MAWSGEGASVGCGQVPALARFPAGPRYSVLAITLCPPSNAHMPRFESVWPGETGSAGTTLANNGSIVSSLGEWGEFE